MDALVAMKMILKTNEDVVDQEIREDHDERVISHDHEDDPTIGNDGDVNVDEGIGTIIGG